MAKKKRKKYVINYIEGDCFVFPLTDGGFARGVVSRMDGSGGLLGYFYGPRFENKRDANVTDDLKPENAIYVLMCGDLGLVDDEHEWEVIGHLPGWKREDWPMPVFGCEVSKERDWGELRWFDENTLTESMSKRVTLKEIKGLPSSGLGGCGYVEKYVSKILRKMEEEA